MSLNDCRRQWWPRYLVLLALIVSGCHSDSDSSAASFEGVIVYRVEVESKVDGVADDEVAAHLGKEVHVYIRGADRRYEYVNGPLVIQRQSTRREFAQPRGESFLYMVDLSREAEPVHSVRLVNETATVLGRKLRCVETKVGDYHFRAFFSEDFPADPSDYEGQLFGATDRMMLLARAVPLRLEEEYRHFRTVHTAIAVEPKTLGDIMFEVPNLPIREP